MYVLHMCCGQPQARQGGLLPLYTNPIGNPTKHSWNVHLLPIQALQVLSKWIAPNGGVPGTGPHRCERPALLYAGLLVQAAWCVGTRLLAERQ